MKKRVKYLISAAATAGFLGLASATVLADSNSIDFESYTAGTINGQDGWSKTGSFDVAVVANTYSIPSFGSQTLRISDAVTSGSFGDQTFSKSLANEAGETDALNNGQSGGIRQPHFEAQFDLASTLAILQTGLHVSVSPDRGDGARMSYLRFEDQADGIHVFFDDVQGTTNPANFIETEIATISRAPHTIKFAMDFVDGPSNDVVKIYIDGVLVHSGTSWENYYRFDSESNPTLVSNSRTVDSLLFRESGSANPSNLGKGFLIDNLFTLSGPIPPVLVGPPTSKDQCKNDGWKTFNNPAFKNQGKCIDYVKKHSPAESVWGTLNLTGPNQKIKFHIAEGDNCGHNNKKNTVEYWNYEYPGGLHYKANVLCVGGDKSLNEARVMFQIPPGNPYSGLYVVAYVKDVQGKNTVDLYGHTATADLATATAWCQTGAGFAPDMYTVTSGRVTLE